MTAEEAEAFEKLPMFTAILRMRKWDDLGKNPDAALQPLEKYRTLCRKYLRELLGSSITVFIFLNKECKL